MNLSLYLATVLIWGTTWIAIKWQVGIVDLTVSIAYRFALAALVLFAFLLMRGSLQSMDRRGHMICLAQGACLFCLNFICFYVASQWVPSGLIAVIFSTAVLWNAFNARLFLGRRIAPAVLGGSAFGMVGLMLLFWPELSGPAFRTETLYGVLLALGGTLCFSFGNMLSSVQQSRGLRPL